MDCELWCGYCLMTCFVMITSATYPTEWIPIKSKSEYPLRPRALNGPGVRYRRPQLNGCSLHKAVMDQHLFYQYVQYKHAIPDLKEFTLCAWHKFYNHSTDHPIFSYAVPHKPKAILSWVANTPKRSYYMLAINGHTIYRLNYPMKLHKWYHMCQSWNGKTGEWQIWINNERVGRGFYNLMVGKVIKGGGIAISGQEQIEYGGGFHWKGKGVGLQGEITLLQLYKSALTVGKAYTDHKHHHVHIFTHDGGYEDDDEETNEIEPSESPETPTETSSEHPFLENGQLKPRLPVHELLAKGPKRPDPVNHLKLPNFHPSPQIIVNDPIFEELFEGHSSPIFKRAHQDKRSEIRAKRSTNRTEHAGKFNRRFSSTDQIKRSIYSPVLQFDDEFTKPKSSSPFLEKPFEFVSEGDFPLHPPFPDHVSIDDTFQQYFKETPPFPQDEIGHKKQEEPAEWEVRKISGVCTGCAEDPFKKANILSWTETPKKLLGGALYVPATPECHIF